MHCVACAHNVENALSGLHGVFSASVNFAESTVDVEYDDTLVSSNQFYECVKSVGCELLDNTESKPASSKKYYKSTKIRTVIAWAFAVLVFYISFFVGNIQTSREFLAIITLLVLLKLLSRFSSNPKSLRNTGNFMRLRTARRPLSSLNPAVMPVPTGARLIRPF